LWFLGVHGGVLILIRCVVLLGIQALFIPLFSYAYVTKILMFLMFWTLANDLIDSRKASMIFPKIAAGGTLGAIIVSFLIPGILRVVPAENLLVVWALLALGAGAIFFPLRRKLGKSFRSASDKQKQDANNIRKMIDGIRLIRGEPLLWNMSLLYFVLFVVLLTQHYLFYSLLKGRFPDAGGIAGFLGYFNGLSMFATFLIQVTVAGFIIRKLGSSRSMFVLPSVLVVVFGALFGITLFTSGSPGASNVLFWAVVGSMSVRIGLFDSFFSPNFQVFFSSLPHEIRGRGKLAIEGVVKPLAMVAASAWLMLVAPRIPFSGRVIMLLVSSGIAVLLVLRLRRTYAETLTRYLRGFSSGGKPELFRAADISRQEHMVSTLERFLDREDPEVQMYAVELLASVGTDESVAILVDRFAAADPKVRATIVSSTGRLKREGLKKFFIDALACRDDRVAANALEALAHFSDPVICRALEPFLNHRSNRVRANAVMALWPFVSGAKREELRGRLRAMLFGGVGPETASALHVLGFVGTGEMFALLDEFYRSSGAPVTADAMVLQRFILTAASFGTSESLDLLLHLGGCVNRKQRNDIASAIGRGGYRAETIIAQLEGADAWRRNVLLKAMLGRGPVVGRAAEQALERIAMEEIRAAYTDWAYLDSLAGLPDCAAGELLRISVEEELIGVRVSNITYSAALLDSSNRVRIVIPRLYHRNKHIRARAFEVLDNSGNSRVNRWLLQLLDPENRTRHGSVAAAQFGIGRESDFSVVKNYSRSYNRWIALCSSYCASLLGETTGDVRWKELAAEGLDA
jgi:HEAT repeat protein